ncbi:MAG TPA: TIGR02147 family protein [Chitinivibrionales bacterium]|nr:TIGR02147 family protein [Chitinivibrionales bacterium]
MKPIFEYLDYRRYLLDYYNEKKRKNPRFSYQTWAYSAGFRSKSYFPELISGKKSAGDDAVGSIARSIGLEGKTFAYFEALVAYNQAKIHEQSLRAWARLNDFNRRSSARLLMRDQHDFYRQWYHHTVRELIVMNDIGGDWKRLASLVVPAITPRQAKASVKLLLRLGLVQKKGKRYELTDAVVTSGDEVKSVAVAEFHLQNLDIAKKAVKEIPASERDVSCVAASLSKQGYAEVKEEVRKFREKLVSIVEKDREQERVYHVNVQLYPTSAAGKEEHRP